MHVFVPVGEDGVPLGGDGGVGASGGVVPPVPATGAGGSGVPPGPEGMVPVPQDVVCALRLVDISNEVMGLFGYPASVGTEYKEKELHPAQEAAFRQACSLLGTYFTICRKQRAGEILDRTGG